MGEVRGSGRDGVTLRAAALLGIVGWVALALTPILTLPLTLTLGLTAPNPRAWGSWAGWP